MQDLSVGAHAPVAGGLAKAALSHVDKVGASAVQVYVGNSRGWARPAGDKAQDELFLAGCAKRGIPAFIHASLLVNVGSPTAATVEQSREVLIHSLYRAQQIGAQGVVFHAGSAVDASHTETALKQVHEVLLPLLEALPEGGPQLLVEPSAGGGRSLASKVDDLEPYFEAVEWHPGLRVCFDTCHAWAAGHDLATPGGMSETLDRLVKVVGPGRLALIHANDSKDPVGSTRDRHTNLGMGEIGAAAFGEMLGHSAVFGVPVVVETPDEHHSRDISLLRDLRAAAI